jgi:hypothetical protein
MTDSTFLSPAHEQVYTEFVTSVTCRSELVHAVFDTMAARDHYLELLVAQLLQYPLDVLEIGPETDVLTLFNPRLTDIPLATATQKVTQGTTSGVLLVRDAEAISATTWSVLFALLRDLPVLNLACVACWRPEQQAQQLKVSGHFRDIRPTFRFETHPPASGAVGD